MANQVMRMPAPETGLQRQSKKPEEDEEKKKRLQMKSMSAAKSEVSPDLQERISGLQQGGGHPLSESERAFFLVW